MYLYGSASAEPFFIACVPGELGSTTAHLRRLPRKGRAGGAYKTLLKHRVQGAALPAMLPSSPSADYISDATLRLCFGRAVFCCPFPGELGSTTAHLRRLPRKGRAGGAYKTLLKHRVQGAALPAMLTSSPSADYISVCTFTALLRQSRFFVACFSGEQGSTTAHLRRLPRKGRAGGAYKTLLKHRVLKQKAWFCVYSANFL